ncbi:MAG: flagellar protein FlaG [Woeseia sp.]
MAEQDIKTVSSATGTFAALRPQVEAKPQTGNAEPQAGKNVPLPEVQKADLEELARALNVASQSIGRDLRFEVDMESGHSVIQVLDRETGEVIRQIPPEKAQISISRNGALHLRLYDERI